jgi:hypothetical protein
LRYEIGLCIQTGWVVWRNGPYPCGAYPDLKIAREKLVHNLRHGEKYIADRGYKDGGEYADTPTGFNNPSQRMKAIVRARHEHINSRLKKFKVLSTTYRNKLDTHHMVFNALINTLQIEIEVGYTLYQVQYDDRLTPELII